MTTISLPLYAAVALAGVGFVLGEAAVRHIPQLRDRYVPEPLVGGLAIAVLLVVIRALGWSIEVPDRGTSVDFLVALLTTNMGLHLTPRVVREGISAAGLFLAGGAALYFVQLLVVFPVASLDPAPLATAVLNGPLSFVGAPYNLNPPAQVPPVAELLEARYPQAEETAQAMMMLGVLIGPILAVFLGKHLFDRAGQRPPEPSAHVRKAPSVPISMFAGRQTHVIVLVLVIIAAAFGCQQLLLNWVPGMKQDHLPVIVLSYVLGGLVRLGYGVVPGTGKFPEKALTILLLGPTMGIVLTYAVMSVPLHLLSRVTLPMLAAGILSVGASAVVAWALYPLFARLAGRYYAVVIATAFLAVTTGWGPVAMSFLRRFTDQSGPVEPMPMILPLNAFFLFPWMAILLTRLVFALAGS